MLCTFIRSDIAKVRRVHKISRTSPRTSGPGVEESVSGGHDINVGGEGPCVKRVLPSDKTEDETVKTKELKVGDRVKIRNSISGTIIEITKNGWIKVVWTFHNDGKFVGMPKRETMIDGFRAADVECIL